MSRDKVAYTAGSDQQLYLEKQPSWCSRNKKLVIIALVVSLIAIIAISAAAAHAFPMAGLVKSVTGNSEASPYDVVKSLPNGIEERIYPAQKWATTEEIGEPHALDNYRTGMFWALFGYIQGKNNREQKIAMTVPVSTKVEADEDKDKFKYQMGFYVPREFQADPPQPTDPKVKIVTRDLHVYTISFGGYAKETDYETKMTELVAYLKENNISIVTAHDSNEPIHFCVGYDAPHKFWNRRNEVWVQVE